MRLLLDNISVSFGEKEVLKDVSFEVNSKDKIAVVGRNGSGKTTLIKVITGEQEIDTTVGVSSSAKIQKSGKFEVGFLKQIAFDDDSIRIQCGVFLCTIPHYDYYFTAGNPEYEK